MSTLFERHIRRQHPGGVVFQHISLSAAFLPDGMFVVVPVNARHAPVT